MNPKLYRCIICGTQAKDAPPRHCPKCGVPAGKFRLVVPPIAPAPAMQPQAAPSAPPAVQVDDLEVEPEDPTEADAHALAS